MICTLFLLISTVGMAQPLTKTGNLRDLKKRWQVLGADSVLQHYPGQGSVRDNTIYFSLDKKEAKNHYLYVDGRNPFSLFLNHQLLILRAQSALLDLDSLAEIYPLPWQFGLYQRDKLSLSLNTLLISPIPSSHPVINLPRQPAYFMNFAIMALLILFAFLVVLLQYHRHFVFDYFNFFGTLLTREQKNLSENSLFDPPNVLHYLFSSLLSAFVLLAILHHAADKMPAALHFPIHSTSEAFYQWIKLSGIIMGILMVKLVIVWLMSTLFNFRESLGIQFYHYIKLLLFVFGVSGMICLMYFVTKTKSSEAYTPILRGISYTLLLFWPISVGAKLLSWSSRSYSHIFFYICASEFIPTVVIVRLLTF